MYRNVNMFTCLSGAKKWVINTRRADLDRKTVQQLHSYFYLCAEHFEESEFANALHNRLKWNALPTKFDVSIVISVSQN